MQRKTMSYVLYVTKDYTVVVTNFINGLLLYVLQDKGFLKVHQSTFASDVNHLLFMECVFCSMFVKRNNKCRNNTQKKQLNYEWPVYIKKIKVLKNHERQMLKNDASWILATRVGFIYVLCNSPYLQPYNHSEQRK